MIHFYENESICQIYLSMNKSMSTCHAQILIVVGRHLTKKEREREKKKRAKEKNMIVSEKKIVKQ